MAKVIEIEHCFECPFCCLMTDYDNFCMRLTEDRELLFGVPDEGIRADCPLKDAAEEQEGKVD